MDCLTALSADEAAAYPPRRASLKLSYAAAGESMIISGSWMNHSVHGRQFKAEFAQRLLPTSANAIYQFLAGGSVKGIGPATASLIVNRFGYASLDVMLNSWE